ncbi:SRPBCC domain-containing protein [Fulvivirgaceae bacterium BMA10]|uniref:SRPBCC domain-containing protein n=1 Tax=Splendidivirga corallicola TaxID=3051826 RepID=A0ABT8KJM7_9BACT|nr:SRPBCC domain-containing protein [Fulvivirgaceae bacterium BMA10]
MTDIKHLVKIKASPEKVYKAITTQDGLIAWWTPQVEAAPFLGSIAKFGFGSTYYKKMKIKDLAMNKRVEWDCLEAVEEWIGTKIIFTLEKTEAGSTLRFEHNDWEGFSDMFSQCSFDWGRFLMSLKKYCETGEGKPYPLD